MRYESNPKHKDPWQCGRRGSLCPTLDKELVQNLLEQSEEDGGKRFACHEGQAYCAQQHAPGRWHGYPVGFKEVSDGLWREWVREGVIQRSDVRKYWEGHQ